MLSENLKLKRLEAWLKGPEFKPPVPPKIKIESTN
jgi:hypothetical protein